ncbi:MAG: histidine kinase [Bacteroidota bacterium]|jgi:hypothetical protein|nr:histidine kinase [Bacteroidota bacterium]
MEDITHFFSNLFNTDSWPPRWHCGEWTSFHGWLYIFSDLAIWGAYFMIPVVLLTFIKKKKDVPFNNVFVLFGAFILACGLTHLIDAVIFWWPAYRLSAVIRFITAVVSWGTIIALFKVIPKALHLKTPAELELIVNERTAELIAKNTKLKELHEHLKNSYEDMEVKIKFRTEALEKTNRELVEEIKRLKG